MPEEKKDIVEEKTPLGDYTLKHFGNKVDNDVAVFEELEEDINEDIKIISVMAQRKSMLMCVVLGNQPLLSGKKVIKNVASKPRICKKYVLEADNGFVDVALHRAIHKKLGYHIVQTIPSHIIPALCQFLHISKEKHVLYLALNKPICPKCHYLLQAVIGYKNEIAYEEKGCGGKDFPWPMPPLAMAYVNELALVSQQPVEVAATMLQELSGMGMKSPKTQKMGQVLPLQEVTMQGACIPEQANTFLVLQHALNTKQATIDKQVSQIAAKDRVINALTKKKNTLQKSLQQALLLAQEPEEKKKENKEESVTNLFDQALASARALLPRLGTDNLIAEFTVNKFGKHDGGLVQKALDDIIQRLALAKGKKSVQERNVLLRNANQAMYNIWYVTKHWPDERLALGIRELMLNALVKGSPQVDTKHIKAFQRNLTRHNMQNKDAVLFIKNSLYALAMAQAAMPQGTVKGNLNALALYLVNMANAGANALEDDLWEAHKKLHNHIQAAGVWLANDPLANLEDKMVVSKVSLEIK